MRALAALASNDRVRSTLLVVLAAALSFSIAVQQSALGVALALLVARCWQARALPRSHLDRPLALVLGALLLSTFASPDVAGSLRGYSRLWLVAAFYVVYELAPARREIERLAWVVVVAGVAVASYGLVQHFTGIDLAKWIVGKKPDLDPFWFGRYTGYRVKGLHPSGITYAHNLLFPLAFASALLSAARLGRRRRIALLAGWSVMALALVFSLTRGVWVALAVVLCLLAAARGGRRPLVAVAGVGLLGILLVGLGPGVRERAASVLDVRANVGRTQIWRANLDMVRERPLLGWGYGNYKRFRAPYYARYPEADTTAHAHNDFLQMLVDGGVVGLAAFVFLFSVVVREGWRIHARLPAAAEPIRSVVLGGVLAVVGFFVGGLTQYNFGDAEVVIALWFTVGLVLAAGRVGGASPPLAARAAGRRTLE